MYIIVIDAMLAQILLIHDFVLNSENLNPYCKPLLTIVGNNNSENLNPYCQPLLTIVGNNKNITI